MTRDRDIERILDHWFTERPTGVADRVLDDVADRIGRQPQQRAWLVLWRDSHVITYVKYAAAVAAVILVAAFGFARFGPSSDSNVGSTASPPISPSPIPSASPSTAPSTSAVFPSWFTPSESSAAAGILPAGNGTTRSFAPGFTFTVPDGWVNSSDEISFYGLFPDTPANQAQDAASGAFANEIAINIASSPWFVCDAWEDNQGATAAEMVDSIVANEALATSEPIDVTIGGLTGKQIDIRLEPGWTGSFPGVAPTLDLGDMRTRGILLDSPDHGVIVIFVNSLQSAGHEAFLAEAMPIIESFEFDLGPEASPS
jgi:hypothetical protein